MEVRGLKKTNSKEAFQVPPLPSGQDAQIHINIAHIPEELQNRIRKEKRKRDKALRDKAKKSGKIDFKVRSGTKLLKSG